MTIPVPAEEQADEFKVHAIFNVINGVGIESHINEDEITVTLHGPFAMYRHNNSPCAVLTAPIEGGMQIQFGVIVDDADRFLEAAFERKQPLERSNDDGNDVNESNDPDG